MDRTRLNGAGRRLVRALAIMAAVQAASQATGQSVIYVDDEAPEHGDGSSWQTAFANLQDGLDRAVELNRWVEIRVAEGVYVPMPYSAGEPGSFVAVGLLSSALTLTIKGGFAGIGRLGDPNRRDARAYPTILSGDVNHDDGPGFTNRDDNSSSVLVLAFLDRGATVIDGLTLSGGNGSDSGGGVLTYQSNLVLIRCTIIDNQAQRASAVSCDGSLQVYLCNISHNRDLDTESMAVWSSYSMQLYLTSVSSNDAGGCRSPDTESFFATIASNRWIGIEGQDWVVVNSSIVWDNGTSPLLSQQIASGPWGVVLASDSIIMGWKGPTDNGVINEDPVFVDLLGLDGLPRTGDEDLRLMGNSPAIDQVPISALDRDRLDLDDDGDRFEPVPFDLAGNARIVGPAVDMGAYEFQICPADLTATSDPADPRYGVPDGSVTIDDFFVFLDLFAAGDPRADLTGSADPSSPAFGVPDGRFGGPDLFAYLAAFELGCP